MSVRPRCLVGFAALLGAMSVAAIEQTGIRKGLRRPFRRLAVKRCIRRLARPVMALMVKVTAPQLRR